MNTSGARRQMMPVIYKQMRRVQSAGVTFVKYYKMLMCETPRRRVLFVHLQSNEVGRGERGL